LPSSHVWHHPYFFATPLPLIIIITVEKLNIIIILFLIFSWRYLCLATNERGRIPLRNVVRTFSSGKPEKMVHKCLADLGLSGDKVSRVRSQVWMSWICIFIVAHLYILLENRPTNKIKKRQRIQIISFYMFCIRI
jgi:hypothetical protein